MGDSGGAVLDAVCGHPRGVVGMVHRSPMLDDAAKTIFELFSPSPIENRPGQH